MSKQCPSVATVQSYLRKSGWIGVRFSLCWIAQTLANPPVRPDLFCQCRLKLLRHYLLWQTNYVVRTQYKKEDWQQLLAETWKKNRENNTERRMNEWAEDCKSAFFSHMKITVSLFESVWTRIIVWMTFVLFLFFLCSDKINVDITSRQQLSDN